MELRRYFDVTKRYVWLVILSAIVAGAVAFIISSSMTPVYQSTSRYLIDEAPGSSSTSNEYSQLLTEQILAQTYVEIATTRPVLEETITTLGLPFSPGELRSKVSVSAPADRQIMIVTVQDTDPQRAAAIANTIGEVFVRQNQERDNLRYAEPINNWQDHLATISDEINGLEIEIGELNGSLTPEDDAAKARLTQQLNEAQIRYTEAFNNLNALQRDQAKENSNIVPIEAAVPNYNPISPRTLLNTLIAAIIGGLAALGLIFLSEYLDNTVKNQDQIQADTGLSTLGAIARIKASDPTDSLIAYNEPRDPLSEAYRVLRTNLGFSAIDNDLSSLVVTSASPGEGKSTTTANLGVVMAQAGKRVIVIDSDLRRPTQHRLFGLGNSHGLTTALLDNTSPASTHLKDTKVRGLRVMTSGPIPPNPAEILSSQRMAQLIDELITEADFLLFDSPPVLSVTDAAVLAPQTQGALFVVQVGETSRDTLRQAVERLRKSNAHVMGVLLNRIKPSHGSYYYYQYYSTYASDGSKSRRRIRRRSKAKNQVGAAD
ncbi:MAG: polysaccharide biosynthesis tyrosine autokinase [Candidatus Promineifilaceae bacterium]